MRMIPSDFWNQFFLPLFVFGKSPKPRKIVFRKIFFSKSSRGRNSQYFLTGLVLNERYFNFAHTYRADFEDFCPWGSENYAKVTQPSKFWFLGPHRPPGAKSALYVCAKFWYLSFKTGSVKKYWELRPWEHFEISKIIFFCSIFLCSLSTDCDETGLKWKIFQFRT